MIRCMIGDMQNEPRDTLNGFTVDERAAMLDGMARASNLLYRDAVRIGHHPFIEFCGLINEYVKICARAHRQGVDFTESSAHSGKPLPVFGHEAEYIGEKLGCIYGPSLQSEENRKKFLQAAGLNETEPAALPSPGTDDDAQAEADFDSVLAELGYRRA